MEPEVKTILSVILIIAVMAAAIAVANQYLLTPEEEPDENGGPDNLPDLNPSVVTRVKDGDTFELASGDDVRLLGINTPETGEPFAAEATQYLSSKVLGKIIYLESDQEDKDGYERLLRHIWIDDNETYLNAEIVRLGHAHLFLYDNTLKHRDALIEAERSAMENQTGIWQPSPYNVTISSYSADEEYVTFYNGGNEPVSMFDWTVKDESWHTYYFGNYTLPQDASVTLRYAVGTDASATLYWHDDDIGSNVWNDAGDSIYLRDEDGLLVDFVRYPPEYMAS